MKDKIIASIEGLQNQKKQHFLLAVSGGIDSMVMLDFFNKNSSLANISVCYVDHNYHANSKKMGKLVSNYCSDNTITYIEHSIDSSKIKRNIESQLREKRYSFLSEACKEINADYIVTAHHSDDQIETILMKILNSSSFTSMRGIQSLNNNLFRPMLDITKDDICKYAKENKVEYISDPTNSDTSLTRNFLRKKVIPMLENIKPNLNKPFEDFQNKTKDMEDLLAFSTSEFMKSDYVSFSKDIYYINKKRFLNLPFLLKINIISKYYLVLTTRKQYTKQNNGFCKL